MGKFNQLSGVAHNLADSFVSVTNFKFLKYIESLPVEKTKLFEIDLLNKIILPKEIDSSIVKKVIQEYNDWFSSEMKKIKIEIKDIEKVSIKVAYKPSKTHARYYTCNVTIKTKKKEYTKKVMSSYS